MVLKLITDKIGDTTMNKFFQFYVIVDKYGKTATTITLDTPIEYRGEQVSQFQHGAPSGHLRNYRRI